jgi:hypothetical protein
MLQFGLRAFGLLLAGICRETWTPWFDVRALRQTSNGSDIETWEYWIRQDTGNEDGSESCHNDGERQPGATNATPAAPRGIVKDR